MYQTEWNQLSPGTVDVTETRQWKKPDGLENQGRKDQVVYRVSTRCRKLFPHQRRLQYRVLFFGKSITDATIKTNQMICSATASPKPHCSDANRPLDSKTNISRLFTILSIVLHEQLKGGSTTQNNVQNHVLLFSFVICFFLCSNVWIVAYNNSFGANCGSLRDIWC